MLKIYENVQKIISQQHKKDSLKISDSIDGLTKTNEEDLIGLVEAIENVKLIINKKKESLKCSLLRGFNSSNIQIKEDRRDLNNGSTSAVYWEHHNLPEFGYQGIEPFSHDLDGIDKEEEKVEDKKGDNFMLDFKDKLNPFRNINNYSKAADKLDEMDLGDNESNLFSDKNSRHSKEIPLISTNKAIEFLK
jgi:hypothetical protein